VLQISRIADKRHYYPAFVRIYKSRALSFSAVVDSDESAIDPSTAPTTPDGSLSFSPVLQAAQLLDAFDGRIGDQTRPGRGSSATLDLDGTAPMVVRNICCVGAGYVGELRPNYVLLSCPSKIDSLGVN
jgi:hypothetical protein